MLPYFAAIVTLTFPADMDPLRQEVVGQYVFKDKLVEGAQKDDKAANEVIAPQTSVSVDVGGLAFAVLAVFGTTRETAVEAVATETAADMDGVTILFSKRVEDMGYKSREIGFLFGVGAVPDAALDGLLAIK